MIPPKPTGSGREAVFAQWVWEMLAGQSLHIQNSSTVSADYTNRGIFLKAAAGGGAVAQSGKVLHFKRSFSEYFTTVEGVAVAKQPSIRNSISKLTIYGTVWNYTYPHNPVGGGPSTDPLAYLYRSATFVGNPGPPENQGLTPQFIANDLICAIPFPTGLASDPLDTSMPPNTPITWLDISGRAWTRFSNQSF